jgi:hypothetical protein
MAPELTALGLVAVALVAYNVATGRPASRFLNPLRVAFMLTAFCAIEVVGGLFGVAFPAHSISSFHEIRQVGEVVWSQVEGGVLLGLLSVPMWVLGLRRLNSPDSRNPSGRA